MSARARKDGCVLVTPETMWWFLLTSVRYSLGRRSYAASLTSDLVRRYWGTLGDDRMRQIAREIRDDLRLGRYEANYDDIRRTWEELAEALEVRTGAPGGSP